MATLSPFSSGYLISTPNSHRVPSNSVPQNHIHFQLHGLSKKSSLTNKNPLSHHPFTTRLKAVEDEDTLIPQQETEQEQPEQEQEQQTVSVPVSPSDTLTMYFQAEGMMNEASIPAVTTALQGTDSIADLKVRVVEGIASVELTKQTTVQATGVASSLVELIQGAGFKLQTLNLSFADEEDVVMA
ncbi:Heavy metal transport/detoxification superfamily protein [Euphorbia peplus]|nr:Heavy metal transport/detoxification superfamily protein [Euphorbia peplus]